MRRVLFITGATASGKTDISLEIAKKFSGEIISSDSMQIYRDMNIGTAKATAEERATVPHHLVDFVSAAESFSVEQYRSLAISAVDDICARGKLPIVVGGTGLYIDALLRGPMSEAPESDPEYRDRMLDSVKCDADRHALWERLLEIDPISAEKTHENNVRRVVRAIEIYEKTGKTKSWFDERSRLSAPDIEPLVLWIDFHDREKLYERINSRVNKMMKSGLLEEVKSLMSRGYLSEDSTAGQAIGYKELVLYLKGQCSLDEAIEEIKLSSRRYAKRQLTWFRHVDAQRVMMDREGGELRSRHEIISEISEIIETKFNLKG